MLSAQEAYQKSVAIQQRDQEDIRKRIEKNIIDSIDENINCGEFSVQVKLGIITEGNLVHFRDLLTKKGYVVEIKNDALEKIFNISWKARLYKDVIK